VIIGLFCLVMAVLPIAVDRASTQIAGIDNPIVQADLLSSSQSYRPESLHRTEEFGKQIPDDDVVHLLLGNLQLQEGNEQQAQVHYQRAAELKDSAGAHVNLGNLHFLNNDFPAAITEYEKAEKADPKLALVFYNNSLASGELYRFDEQGQKLEQAKRLARSEIEHLTQNPPPQKVVIYTPPLEQAWEVSTTLARHGAAQTLFGAYSYFDPASSALNPVTIGSLTALLLAIGLWLKRRKPGFANACIKCGRTFCYRCKSARESATYCTQCIHIYLKRDGVSLDTKRRKLEEVQSHQTGMLRRNRILATFLPGSAQVLEGRTVTGVAGIIAFLLFISISLLIGRLAPALAPVAQTPQLLARIALVALALITWLLLSLPVYRRKQPSV
jgi:tetratricopeptide (TPR) repeat protein